MDDLIEQRSAVMTPQVEQMGLAVVAAVNSDAILKHNLLRSSGLEDGSVPFHDYRNCRSVAEAYNRGLDETKGDIVIFAHQDVYLPQNWQMKLRNAVDLLSKNDPDWAVFGAVGMRSDGSVVGQSWSSGIGRIVGNPIQGPVQIVCVDEMLIVLRRASGLRFDPNLPGFHLYGTDIVLAGLAAGKRSYIVDFPVVHNSQPVRGLGGAYTMAHSFMRRKWAALMPIPTLIAPLTRNSWPLLRARLRLARSLRRRLVSAVNPMTDPRHLARTANFEP